MKRYMLLVCMTVMLAAYTTYAGPSMSGGFPPDGSVPMTGTLFINDTENDKMTLGITVNQGANDDEILAFKSSDVGHRFTNIAQADSYGTIGKQNATVGGLKIRGFASDTMDGVLSLAGNLGITDPTDTHAAVLIKGAKANNDDPAPVATKALGAAETVLRVDNKDTPVITVLGNGDTTYTGAVTATGFNTTRVASDSVSLTNAQSSTMYEDIDDGDNYRIFRMPNLTSTHVQLEPVGDPTAGQVKAYGVPAGGPPAVSTGTWVTPLTTSTTTIPLTGNLTGLEPVVIVLVPSGTSADVASDTVLTHADDSSAANAYVGMTVYNITDATSCTVTASTGTTITCVGSTMLWSNTNAYQLGPGPTQSGSYFYVAGDGTLLWPATVGYRACVMAEGTPALRIDFPANMVFTGTLNTAVESTSAAEYIASSDSTADDYICIHNKTAILAKGLEKRGTWTQE